MYKEYSGQNPLEWLKDYGTPEEVPHFINGREGRAP